MRGDFTSCKRVLQTVPLLTTSTGARRTTPSRLGGFTSKSNKCTTKIDEAQQVLKVRIALICSLTLNHTAPTLNCALSTSLPQREGWGEALQRLGKSGASAARPEAVGWVYILIPLKLVVRIRKLAVVTVQVRQHRSPYGKSHNFLLRTPFTVILDFSESLFRGLSNPAENKLQDQLVQVQC